MRTIAETGSTNDDMAAAARAGEAEGMWLRAERQSAGRGRERRAWVSVPGNLHASTIVRLRVADPPAATLALVTAVALHDALSAFGGGATFTIKWPNDILAGDAKVAGILLERHGDAVIVGCGANLAHHPDLEGRSATDLAALSGIAPEPDAVLHGVATAFARWLDRWRREGLAPVLAAWRAAAHPRGTALTVSLPAGTTLTGAFDGLEPDGALRLRLADGAARVIHAGDVFLARD